MPLSRHISLCGRSGTEIRKKKTGNLLITVDGVLDDQADSFADASAKISIVMRSELSDLKMGNKERNCIAHTRTTSHQKVDDHRLPIDFNNLRGDTSASPASWKEIGFLIERGSG
ncbi:hypothetical protein EVAR_24629_1 [Eumeta japonica]|uniref:Uncharacterized protein n=1 Tax=Eumeta variegata TaxID=151549 RepID=A0A4C1V2M0_EUMVA|nr:hypothetical protein EVAR_24629_1 [Eumeta japonica]